MGRIPKGVVTLGVTYAQSRHTATGGAWHIDPAVAAGIGMDCPAHGHDSPELVHELLDHWIPGFPLRGAGAEAKALVQFAARTGADPMPGLRGIVDRLLLQWDAHAAPPTESLRDLLPTELHACLPRTKAVDEAELRRHLRAELGDGLLRAHLSARLLELGWQGMAPARATWFGRGLDFHRRQALARALGRVLAWMEYGVQGWEQAHGHGELAVANDMVRFRFDRPAVWEWACEVGPP